MRTWIYIAFAVLLTAAAGTSGAAVVGELPVAPLTTSTWSSGIAAGPDGSIWFSTVVPNRVGRITPSGAVTQYSIGGFGMLTAGMTVGPDGNLWFTKEFPGTVIRMTPGGTVTEFPVSMDSPGDITVGPDGNLWVTSGYKFARITPAGVLTEFPAPEIQIGSIVAGPDGNLWFGGRRYPAAEAIIGRITPAGTLTWYSLGGDGFPTSITAGPDGNLWFTFGSNIGRITTGGTFTLFPYPVTGGPTSITTGPDGNLWFTDYGDSRIGRITPAGSYVLPFINTPSFASHPQRITTSPDGLMWFYESNNKIGVVTPADISGFFPLSPGASWTYLQNGATPVTRSVTGTAMVGTSLTTVVHGTDDGGNDVYWTSDANGIRDHREVYGPSDNVTFSQPLTLASPQPVFGTTVFSGGTATGIVDVPPPTPFSFPYTLAVTPFGIETVTVPAGTFKAIKNQSTFSIPAIGASSTQINWVAANVGPVKDVIDGVDTFALTGTSLSVTTPDVFSYVSPSAAPPVTPSSFAVTGITVAAPISITGGQYSINGGPFTSTPGTVSNGQTVTVRPVASVNAFLKQAVVTIGGVTGTFNSIARNRTASDFNADGKSDILWRDLSTGDNAIWQMDGTTLVAGPLIQGVPITPPGWTIAGVGDFNGDGKADILWRDTSTGNNAIWLMDGFTLTSAPLIQGVPVTPPGWTIAGVGDFNGDGKADILWRNTSTGDNAIWQMDGPTLVAGPLIQGVPASGWVIAGVGDFNGDGKADILWRDEGTGNNAIWLMDGFTLTSAPLIQGVPVTPPGWTIAGVGDFNGDGKADILWRNTSTGDNAIWQMDGPTLVAGPLIQGVPASGWVIAGVGDFNGDGKADILWRDEGTGNNAIWLMDGFTLTSGPLIQGVPAAPSPTTGWHVQYTR